MFLFTTYISYTIVHTVVRFRRLFAFVKRSYILNGQRSIKTKIIHITIKISLAANQSKNLRQKLKSFNLKRIKINLFIYYFNYLFESF